MKARGGVEYILQFNETSTLSKDVDESCQIVARTSLGHSGRFLGGWWGVLGGC